MMTDISVELPGVMLGVVETDDVRVQPSSPDLTKLINGACEDLRSKLSLDSLADAESTQVVRSMFRGWGVDPSKYRPSSEALRRRVVQGKGLYPVSNIVDIGNLGSIETGWPFGLYDRTRLHPPIAFRQGTSGELYEGIGKRTWHLEGRPVLADADGAFGSPISDSTRTMVTGSARQILAVIYAPASAGNESIRSAMARLCQRLTQHGGCSSTREATCG
jgi:DNA/RNA-binding domain of Phe-tRNA-synthetase-like protein